MGKKTKSKQRLDKFYNLAKEQGYRSRAAFKLIQLNKKYNLFNDCNVVIDLCAAPGGWCQVASSIMPLNSTIIGLDLVSIKPIPHCRTFQQDITTPACFQLLQNELRGSKADLVLHDGAPNVGASWAKDAYTQNELVLHSLRLAASFLKKGGTFVSKVFRSADYNSLLWVFNKFFERVEATKPVASRNVSAEIFIVCLGFTAPQFVDEKLFQANHVFKESERDLASTQRQLEITSIAKLFEKRRNRTGYADDAPLTVYGTLKFEEFLKAQNPYPLFLEYNRIEITPEEREYYFKLAKPPADIDESIQDIKVLGKREVIQLLKWRSKIKHQIGNKNRKNNVETEDQEEWQTDNEEEDIQKDEVIDQSDDEQQDKEEQGEEVYEDLVEMQMELLEKEAEQGQKKDIKEQRKKKERQQKLDKKRVGMHSELGLESDEEIFNLKKHSKQLKKAQYIDFNEEEEKPQKKSEIVQYEQTPEQLNELNETIEQIYERKQQKKLVGIAKGQEQAKLQKERTRRDIKVDVDSDDLACEPVKKKLKISKEEGKQIKDTLNSKKFFDRDLFASLKESLKKQIIDQGVQAQTFTNPIKIQQQKNQQQQQEQNQEKKKRNILESDSEDQDQLDPRFQSKLQRQIQKDLDQLNPNFISQEPFPDEEKKIKLYEMQLPVSEMEKRRRRLKKEKQKEQKKKEDQKEDGGEIEIVPAKTFDDYNIDDLAYNRALAKKMFRKGIRDSIIEKSFSRHALEDDEDLPQWFAQDELKHQYKIEPITKEDYQAEKEKLLSINNKVPKKIMEVKIRRWKKAQKKMRKASQKAQQIFDQEGVNEMVKLKQVKKLYKKEAELQKTDKEKKYIVSKKGRPIKGGNSKGVKLVDRRLKKDKRAQKALAKKKIRKIGHGKKRRQVNRHKGKKQKS